MAATLQTTNSNTLSWNKIFIIFYYISQKFVLKGVTDHKSAIVQSFSWCQTGKKPLPEPMMTHISDRYDSSGLNILITEITDDIWGSFY